MKIKHKKRNLISLWHLIIYGLLLLTFNINAQINPSDIVSINNRKILLGGEEYIIRGICYNPFALGNDRFVSQDYSKIDEDISLMLEAEINTVRTYSPITDVSVLDKFANAGIKIIMGFPNFDDRWPPHKTPDIQTHDIRLGGTENDTLADYHYLNYIKGLKDHPAILMWEFGNEYVYHPEWFDNDISNWYSILENVAQSVHLIDPNHPVSTAHGDVDVDINLSLQLAPSVDVYGFNTYRWDDPEAAFTTWESLSSKPMYLSEAGADSWSSNATGTHNGQPFTGFGMGREDVVGQANATRNILNDIGENLTKDGKVCAGVTVFEFHDEWWKTERSNGGNPYRHDQGGFPNPGVAYDGWADEEYWGIVDIYRNPKPVYYTLNEIYSKWKGENVTNNTPVVGIILPVTGTEVNNLSSITIDIEAQDIDGSISTVEVFANNLKIGDAIPNGENYQFIWNVTEYDIYNIDARVTDNNGASSTSNTVDISVIQAVTIDGRKIMLGNEQYVIRGVCYNPISQGNDRFSHLDFSNLDKDIALMKEANINTIRTYHPITKIEVLDAFAEAGIKVIMGFPNYDDRNIIYKQPDIQPLDARYGTDTLYQFHFLEYIEGMKNHPAILMWEFGNEYVYHPEWFDNNIINWYQILENTIQQVHAIDSNHPVSTAHGDVAVDISLSLQHAPSVDVYGFNTYRFDNPEGTFTDWAALSSLPMYFSEIGADSWSSNETGTLDGQPFTAFGLGREDLIGQAKATKDILNDVFSDLNVGSGATLFEFHDEWWKSEKGTPYGQNSGGFPNPGVAYDGWADEEYWGIVDIDRNKKPVFEIVKDIYGNIAGQPSSNVSPVTAILSPINNGGHYSLSNVTIEIEAWDANGSISSVEIFADGDKLGDASLNGENYQLNWIPSSFRTYKLQAKVTDNEGATSFSNNINFHVNKPVTVDGRKIMLGDEQYIIRGVCYNPFAIGDDRFKSNDFSKVSQDIALMKEAHINTIRTYTPIVETEVLDAFAEAGIKIIMGFPNYDDRNYFPHKRPDIQPTNYPFTNDTLYAYDYLSFIKTVQHHPAILMWEFGNEYVYHPEWFENNIVNWYNILEETVQKVHLADPNHPVSTAHGDVDVDISLSLQHAPSVDVYGFNTYRWDNPEAAFPTWAALSTKPMYLSEAGADSWSSNETGTLNGQPYTGSGTGTVDLQGQATATSAILDDIFNNLNVNSGVTVFEFHDEWWKSENGSSWTHDSGGFPNPGVPYDGWADEEYWGIVDINRNKKPVFEIIKNKFGEYDDNLTPTVQITNPNGQLGLPTLSGVTVEVNATDSDGGITKVVLYVDGEEIGEDYSAPYEINWNVTTYKTYQLVAKGIDNDFGISYDTINVEVSEGVAPEISITSPLDSTRFLNLNPISLNALASISEGSISQVEFLIDNVVVGSDTESPYSLNWIPTSFGTYNFSAIATSSEGVAAISETFQFLVYDNLPPTINIDSPLEGGLYTSLQPINLSATATDEDGSITNIDFSVNDILVGSGNNLNWTPGSSGNYTIKAFATDDDGATSEDEVNIIVNLPPEISIESPFNEQIFNSYDSISITTSANDIDGEIQSVEIFVDNSSIITLTETPYVANFQPTQGLNKDYIIIAIVTDNLGLTASDTISVTVNYQTPSCFGATSDYSYRVQTTSQNNDEITFTFEHNQTTNFVDLQIESASIIVSLYGIRMNDNGDNSNSLSLNLFQAIPIQAGQQFNYRFLYQLNGNPGHTIGEWFTYTVSENCITNNPPEISITQPSDQQVFYNLNEIDISAIVTGTDDGLSNVEIKINDEVQNYMVNGDTYSVSYLPAIAGNYILEVIATDNDLQISNQTIQFSVVIPDPLIVTINTPSDGELFTGFDPITIQGNVNGGVPAYNLSLFANEVLIDNLQTNDNFSFVYTPSESGVYSIEVRAADNIGQNAIGNINITVNEEPTNCGGSTTDYSYSVSTSSETNDEVSFTFSHNQPTNFADVQIESSSIPVSLYGIRMTDDGNNNNSLSINYFQTVPIQAGQEFNYRFLYQVTGEPGHTIGEWYTYTVGANCDNNNAPIAVINSPLEGTVFNSLDPISINATVTDIDDGLASVNIKVNNVNQTVNNSGDTYYSTFTPAAEGVYVLEVIATDIGGNITNESVSFSISLQNENSCQENGTDTSGNGIDYITSMSGDLTNPTISFNPLRNGVGSSNVILYYQIDGGGLIGEWLTQNGVGDNEHQITGNQGQLVSYYFTYSVPEGGERNNANNRHEFVIGNCRSTDPIPSVSITSPINGESIAEGSPIVLSAIASDNGAVTNVYFEVNNVNIGNGTLISGSNTNGTYELSNWEPTAGTYKIIAKATDNLGQLSSSTQIDITITGDPSGSCSQSYDHYSFSVLSLGDEATINFTSNYGSANLALLSYIPQNFAQQNVHLTHDGGNNYSYTIPSNQIEPGETVDFYFTYNLSGLSGQYDNASDPYRFTVSDCGNFRLKKLDFLPENEEVLLYPNPTAGLLNIKTSKKVGFKSYTLYSLTGKLLKTGNFEKEIYKIDVSEIKKGAYLLVLKNEIKIVIKRFFKN